MAKSTRALLSDSSHLHSNSQGSYAQYAQKKPKQKPYIRFANVLLTHKLPKTLILILFSDHLNESLPPVPPFRLQSEDLDEKGTVLLPTPDEEVPCQRCLTDPLSPQASLARRENEQNLEEHQQ